VPQLGQLRDHLQVEGGPDASDDQRLPDRFDLPGCNPPAAAHSCDAARALLTISDNCDGEIAVTCTAGPLDEQGCYRKRCFT